MKILIIGNARHGKDTVADMIKMNFGLEHKSSSEAALDIFLYDKLVDKYNLGYKLKAEAFEDRVNHRVAWHDEICEYNKEDPARLAKEIMSDNDIYVGMRSKREIDECKRVELFDLIIGVYDPRKPEEDESSNDISVLEESDVVVMNDGSLEDLEISVVTLMNEHDCPIIYQGGCSAKTK